MMGKNANATGLIRSMPHDGPSPPGSAKEANIPSPSVQALQQRMAALHGRVAELELEVRRSAGPAISRAFALARHEASRPTAGGPLANAQHLLAALGRAEALLARTLPVVRARRIPLDELCWFANTRPAPKDGGVPTPVAVSACPLALLSRKLIVRVICFALDGGRQTGVVPLQAVARVFALPQLCLPALQPLVSHARGLVARAKREAADTASRMAASVEISGASGVNAPAINGAWEATLERRRGRVVYRKRLDGEDETPRWLCVTSMGWMVQARGEGRE